ncbi:MAG: acyl-CoA dehydrogenase family protein [Actinomycetota bacterium]
MDLGFTPDQDSLSELAAQIFAGHTSTDRLKQAEADVDRFDRTLWAELARADLLGVGTPEADGGLGGGLVETCLLLEQAGATVAPVPLWPTLVLGTRPVARHGSSQIRSSLLPRVAAGEIVLSAALAEPDAGDPLIPATTGTWEGDAWRLEGEKVAVPAAHIAERILIPARTDAGVGIFLLDPRSGGVTVERQSATSGEIVSKLSLDGAAVPEDDVLVDPGSDGGALARLYDEALTGLCALQVGTAERALRMTAAYLSEREQFGRPLGKFQAVQQRAADAYIDVEAMRWTMWQAAWLIDEGAPASDEVAIAKFWAAEGGHRVLAAAQHLHGGVGVDLEYPLHRYTLGAKHAELTLGGANRQLARLGASMAAKGGR